VLDFLLLPTITPIDMSFTETTMCDMLEIMLELGADRRGLTKATHCGKYFVHALHALGWHGEWAGISEVLRLMLERGADPVSVV
jgi:hypothetical protein